MEKVIGVDEFRAALASINLEKITLKQVIQAGTIPEHSISRAATWYTENARPQKDTYPKLKMLESSWVLLPIFGGSLNQILEQNKASYGPNLVNKNSLDRLSSEPFMSAKKTKPAWVLFHTCLFPATMNTDLTAMMASVAEIPDARMLSASEIVQIVLTIHALCGITLFGGLCVRTSDKTSRGIPIDVQFPSYLNNGSISLYAWPQYNERLVGATGGTIGTTAIIPFPLPEKKN